jgi:tetratricopeptide (TPR) repeat protein
MMIVLYWYSGNSSEKLFAERYQPYRVNVERSDKKSNSAVSPARAKMIEATEYMQSNRFDAAIPLLSGIISQNLLSGNRLYHDEAEYYLALAYLKQKQYDSAYQLFDKIYVDKEHTYNAEVNWWFLTRVKWLK